MFDFRAVFVLYDDDDHPCNVSYCDFNMYADDVQLYFSGRQNELIKISDTCMEEHGDTCIRAVNDWIKLKGSGYKPYNSQE